ncbi:putative photosynthetic complex assembly protein PuhE [Candidatus Oscillochloris fontis]|uniref:putative photosynthetic complex assembly protein PuhE n=1 Tax=Candidatus Oscillochloris fontis TaxID=2496868 RepID=UPI001EE9A0BB|nr:putative photosynthetic complex assembly protein PuhE [Candidatus Oscillochloris fontis]
MLPEPPVWAQTYLYPPLAVVLLWVALTAGVMGLNQRGPRAARLGLIFSLPLLGLAHWQLVVSRHDLSTLGAYQAFMAGMLIWAWHELAFYSGILSGPWKRDCPSHARGFSRLGYALATHLYHELACLAEIILMLVALSDATNWVGFIVFCLSWALQHSAKLNVLLGVPWLQVDLFPSHLRYLGSFWARHAPSCFFLPSVSVSTLLAGLLWLTADSLAPAPVAVRLALIASVVTLGAIEHWLLLLPVRLASTTRQVVE